MRNMRAPLCSLEGVQTLGQPGSVGVEQRRAADVAGGCLKMLKKLGRKRPGGKRPVRDVRSWGRGVVTAGPA